MKTITAKDLPLSEFHNLLLTAVAPRPICFASTIDENGNPNLSPYSFFNVFGSNPVTFIFSPARRVRDNTIKHTLQNIYKTNEVAINVVSFGMVQQASLASCEYPKNVNEFVKAGFTMLPSLQVKPFRVKESPVQFECKVKQVIETGNDGGAGNLVVCEMLLMHINSDVMTLDGKIDQHKIDLVGRLGSDWYVRASGNALFEVPKPNKNLGIGVDMLPDAIKYSKILTGNDLSMLGNAEKLPDADNVEIYKKLNKELNKLLAEPNAIAKITALHNMAKKLLAENKIQEAWKVLLSL